MSNSDALLAPLPIFFSRRGKTSQVYYGVNHKTQEKVAIKVIDRRRLIANPDLVTEVNVLKKLSHPNIVRLIDVFITPENLQIVMELYVQAQKVTNSIFWDSGSNFAIQNHFFFTI